MGDRRSMGSKGLPLALLLLGAAVIALALLATVIATTPYVGSDRCATEGCHDEIYSSWRDTGHGSDFTDFNYHDEMINLLTRGGNVTTGMTGSCAVCHVVGYDDVANGGFDPTKPWNDTYNLPLLSIGCEACHGAATGHPKDDKLPLTEETYATSCSGNGESGCHGGNRQYGNETIPGWEESAHANELPEERQGTLSCANCRATEGFIARMEGTPLTAIPEDGLIWKITCMACHDPHPDEGAEEHMGQLRAPAEEICEDCHYSTSSWPGTNPHHPQTEMRTGQKGQDVTSETWMGEVSCPECHMFTSARGSDPYYQSHSWVPRAEACMVCHSEWETPEEVHEYIEGVAAKTEAKLTALEPYITDLGKLKSWAQKNESTKGGLWTDALNTSYNKALWNYNLVINDKSMGMHNPQYAWAMLDSAMENAGAVKDALNIGGISGKVEYSGTPAEPIPNATIKDGNGNQVAKTGTDGTFFFWGPARNRLYVVELDGKPIGTFMADGQAQMNKTIATTTIEKAVIPEPPEPEEEDESMLNSLSYGLIAVIVILIILLAVFAMRKK